MELGRSKMDEIEKNKSMQGNKRRDTTPELRMRKLLREAGFPVYCLQWMKVPGRPDIAYPGRKIAIFVNGCFWHRCPRCNLPLPKSNQAFWKAKFRRNTEREQRKIDELEALGWTVFVVWECELKDSSKSKSIEYVFLNIANKDAAATQ
jgi:DNA mismatch endonuclease (patch repair protein)